jgi:protein kinase A
MIEKKHTFNRKKTLVRSATIITSNENNIEKFKLEDYKIGNKIGKTNLGGYYYICKSKKGDKVYSLKILKKIDILQSKIVERLNTEYRILSNIYHPFIIELKGIDNNNPYTLNFLYEYIAGGTLNTLIKSYKRLSIDHAKFYLASLVTTLDYLHQKNIIFRDLKPDNILINSNGYIKLCSFLFSKKMDSDITFTTCGTPEYYAPEMINKSGYNKSVDFWGLGILLYEMLVGCTPFMDPDPIKMYQKINKGKILFPKTINKDAKMLIKHFLEVDVNKRLGCGKRGVSEIVENKFFDGFDWKGLLYRSLKPPYTPPVSGVMDTSNFIVVEDNPLDDEDNVEVPKDKDPYLNW